MKVTVRRRSIPRSLRGVAIVLAAMALFQAQTQAAVTALGAREASQLLDERAGDPAFALLDMRTPDEFKQGHIQGAALIDYYSADFKAQLDRLDRGKTYLIYCRSGNRTGKALKIMEQMGFTDVIHLRGGILEWRALGLPLVQTP